MDDKLNNNEKNDIIKKPKHKKKRNKDLKIIIVGNSGAGKTSLVNKYIHNKFAQTYSPTIASQFSYKIYKKDDVIYRVQFWDIAGQDKNPETTGIFCQNTKGIVLCCEVNQIETRNDTIKWKESIEKNINIENIPIILVENKCDLLGDDENKYNKDLEELNTFGENNNLSKCFRTSALNGFNVEESFNFLIDEIIQMFGYDNSDERKDTMKLQKEGQQTNIRSQQKNKCC